MNSFLIYRAYDLVAGDDRVGRIYRRGTEDGDSKLH